MAKTPTAEQDAWVRSLIGLDPGTPSPDQAGAPSGPSGRRTAAQQLVTDAVNLGSDIVTEANIAGEAVKQAGLGAIDKAADLGASVLETAKNVVGWGTPATAPPVGPVNLTSLTEEALPAPRTRTRLGVGERVELTVTGGAGNWHAAGGKLSAKTGTKVTLTAPDRPATVVVTVDVGGTERTLSFTVIAPSIVRMVRTSTTTRPHYPNAAMTAAVYIGPDDVNFVATTNTEDEVRAKADGCWDEFNGIGHSPNPAPSPCSSRVVPGLGTHSPGDDTIDSGVIPQPVPAGGDWSGTLTFTIPWHWQCHSGAGLIDRVVQRVVTDAAGTTTISKAGASYTAALSP